MSPTKLVIFLGLTLTIVNAMPKDEDVPVLGGIKPVSDVSQPEKALKKSLDKLAAGDGPNYKLGKIYSATEQTVAGHSYKIVADLIDSDGKTTKCKVSIWSRDWLPDGIEVTFECDGQDKVIKKHSA